jgi:hypothetical protein
VDSLDAEEQTAMHDALHHVLTTAAASGAHLHFGICQDLRVPRWKNLLQLNQFTAATC